MKDTLLQRTAKSALDASEDNKWNLSHSRLSAVSAQKNWTTHGLKKNAYYFYFF